MYLTALNPKYNILLEAGTSIGYKHTDETKKLISIKNNILLSVATLLSFLGSIKGLIVVSFFLVFILKSNKQRIFLFLDLIGSGLIINITKIFVLSSLILGVYIDTTLIWKFIDIMMFILISLNLIIIHKLSDLNNFV